MRHLTVPAIIFCVLIIASCTPSPRYRVNRPSAQTPSGATAEPGKPEEKPKPGTKFRGVASFYADDYHGKKTSNGEVYDMYGLTAAHRTLPFNVWLEVKNLSNGRTVIVRVNDRGPFIEGRILDLSYGAARELQMLDAGIQEVEIVVLR